MKNTELKLLVTGGAGFIGSCFVGECIKKGHKVIVYDALTYAGHKENLSYIKNQENLDFIEGDIRNGGFALDIIKQYDVDAVLNFAAESHVDNSIEKPGDFIETNILGTYAMLEASRAYWNLLDGKKKDNFRYIQVSTDEVYGTLGEEGYFTEGSPMKPNSPYSSSKAAGDHLARAWFETYKFPTIVTNCSNNYGARQHPEKLIPKIILNALSEIDIPIYGDGKNVRDWIHVEDHSEGVYLALTHGKLGETYCFGGNSERRNIEVAETICGHLDKIRPRKNGESYKNLIKFVIDRPGHDRRYAIDSSKSEKTLGFKRKFTFNDGIKNTVEWYLNNKDWCKLVSKKK